MAEFKGNKIAGRKLAMAYSSLGTNRQKEMAVISAEQETASHYRRLLKFPKRKNNDRERRAIGAYVSFLLLVKGVEYTKTALYRIMLNLHVDGLIWISWKSSGHPKPKTAYFFVKRTIRKTIEPMRGTQISYWCGEPILYERRKYE